MNLTKLAAMAESQPMLLGMLGLSWAIIDQELMKVKRYKEKSVSREDRLKEYFIQWESWVKKYKERLSLEFSKDKSGEKSIEILNENKREVMKSVNPRYVLRNHLAQNAIEFAENGDYSEVNKLLRILLNPFKQLENEKEDFFYSQPLLHCDKEICVSCSS